jgi:ABC-type multidrug transport system fused ATPase/permease subunit
MTQASATPAVDTHPIRLVNNDDLKRNRLTVFFRLILAIPHFIWLTVWLFVLYIAGFFFWLIALFAGRLPDGIHNFVGRFTRYSTHVYAYSSLLADPFPGFTGAEASYPIDLQIDPPQQQNRLGIFFRFLLAIPAFILAYILRILMNVLAFVGWFYALFTGRMSEGIESLGTYALRYEAQTFAYAFLLTGKYPSLGGAPTA